MHVDGHRLPVAGRGERVIELGHLPFSSDQRRIDGWRGKTQRGGALPRRPQPSEHGVAVGAARRIALQ